MSLHRGAGDTWHATFTIFLDSDGRRIYIPRIHQPIIKDTRKSIGLVGNQTNCFTTPLLFTNSGHGIHPTAFSAGS